MHVIHFGNFTRISMCKECSWVFFNFTDDLRKTFGPSQQVGRRGTPPHLSNSPRYNNGPYSQSPPLYENVVELQQYPPLMGDTIHHLPLHVRTFYQPKGAAPTGSTSSIPSYGHFSNGIYPARSVDETLDSIATGYDDDDTTTSGSYTIDVDEYPVEVRLQKVPDVFVWGVQAGSRISP